MKTSEKDGLSTFKYPSSTSKYLQVPFKYLQVPPSTLQVPVNLKEFRLYSDLILLCTQYSVHKLLMYYNDYSILDL